MAFVLSVGKLVEAMKLPGCPVCRRAWQTSNDTMEIFLWENVNDPDIRGEIIDAYGFCSYHTRLLASRELSNSGVALGVNIIYEQLGRVVRKELEGLAGRENKSFSFSQLFTKQGGRSGRVMPAKDVCPACKLTQQAVVNTLSTLFESLEKGVEDLRAAYLESDRLCFNHLRLGLEHFGERDPNTSKFLIDDAIERLDQTSEDMRAFIRKNNWEYRDEVLTPEENNAWQRMLGFFTGVPGPVFTFRIPQFDKGEYNGENSDCP